MIEELKVDSEFEDVIPPLSDDEFQRLEENIVAEGIVRDPLVLWNGVIVDGHNRRRILIKHPEIPYTIHEMTFADKYEAMTWICKNQLGRRNLTEAQREIIIGKRFKAEKQPLGASDGFRGNQHTGLVIHQNDGLPKPKNRNVTAQKIGAEFGMSSASVERAGTFVDGLEIADEYEPGISREIAVGTLKPAKSDVIAIAKAPVDKRQQLTEHLRVAQAERDEAARRRREQRKRENDAHPPVSDDSVFMSVSDAVDTLIRTCNMLFKSFPTFLTKKDNRDRTVAAMQKLIKYIDEIKGEENG